MMKLFMIFLQMYYYIFIKSLTLYVATLLNPTISATKKDNALEIMAASSWLPVTANDMEIVLSAKS